MNERTWIDPRCDRSQWPAGAWDGEPDKAQWKDEATGLACLAKRHPSSGHWCGYVGIPPEHPLHGKEDEDCNLEVHGGITFGAHCQEGPPETTVCHIPGLGEPEHLWWLGFDCAHAWDYSPSDKIREIERGYPFTIGFDQSYKSLAYVKNECARLAAQVRVADNG